MIVGGVSDADGIGDLSRRMPAVAIARTIFGVGDASHSQTRIHSVA